MQTVFWDRKKNTFWNIIFLSDGDTPPKKSAEVILPTSPSPVLSEETDYKIEGEGQAELRLLDEETVQASDDINTNIPAKNKKAPGGSKQEPEKTQAEKRVESESVPASFRCQMVMAICAVLGLIPLLCIVIYLVGMFWMVPSTLNLTSWPEKINEQERDLNKKPLDWKVKSHLKKIMK